ncbi:MAG: RDD family protein [Alphaproteobacteria bacterium]|nr:RDD family protein [Alphaproteobacteria bacterium]
MLLDTTTSIATPERVRFRHRVAGPGRRFAAWALDAFVQSMVLVALASIVGALGAVGLEGFGTGALLVTIFLLQWFYGSFFESVLAGQTPGKLALSLRVVTDSGAPARVPQLVLRNLLKGADFLPVLYGVGVLVMLFDERLRRIGDLVAGTVVVDETLGTMLGSAPIEPPVTDEERRGLPARVDLTRDELGVIEEFLRRRARMSDERANELAELLAPALTTASGVEAETPERVLVLAYARATGRDRVLEGPQ